jgi:hypothetical protein
LKQKRRAQDDDARRIVKDAEDAEKSTRMTVVLFTHEIEKNF